MLKTFLYNYISLVLLKVVEVVVIVVILQQRV